MLLLDCHRSDHVPDFLKKAFKQEFLDLLQHPQKPWCLLHDKINLFEYLSAESLTEHRIILLDLTMQINCVNHCKGWFGKYLHRRPALSIFIHIERHFNFFSPSPSLDLRTPEAEHVCLQLSISKECLVWVSTHHLPLETPSGCQLDDVFQPDPYCSAAQTSLLCRARGSRSFVRDGKRKVWGRTVFGCSPDH